MNIENYIKNRHSKKIIGRGSTKNCYDFGEYVLLETAFLEKNIIKEKLENIKYIKEVLDKIDVNSFKILDYSVNDDRIYILESKVDGSFVQRVNKNYYGILDDSLYNDEFYDRKVDDYIKRLYQLNKKSILKKFVLDYFKLIDNGLFVDYSSPSNFLYDKEKGISFLDIDKLDGDYDKRYIFYYIFYNITYFNFDVDKISNDNIIEISTCITSIYYRLVEIYKEFGFPIGMYTFALNGTVSEFLTKKIRDFIILTEDKDKVFVKEL